MRQAQLARKTKETDIKIAVKLDNMGTANIDTGIGFFDHMLTALSVHSGISMDIAVKGDLYVHVYVETPVKLNAEQKDLLRKFGESLEKGATKHTPKSSGFMEKMKKFFGG